MSTTCGEVWWEQYSQWVWDYQKIFFLPSKYNIDGTVFERLTKCAYTLPAMPSKNFSNAIIYCSIKAVHVLTPKIFYFTTILENRHNLMIDRMMLIQHWQRTKVMYLQNCEYNFLFENFFLLRYIIQIIYDKMVDGPHPKSFSEHFRRGAQSML